ncbi:unnamed protein product [Paramecium pentaurelia]|uniref:Uncharacterized protein n=1 Tax=Paramecium pentaurelia TaxID=43138 RepID=A0A8S1WF99_9CILI|nr:unnamed protein product [Paramecium pentaurelia]CAD8187347.1 unnamed protein product [Paramecium pentaurelia]
MEIFFDNNYKNILRKFKSPIFKNKPQKNSTPTYITILLISQQLMFQSQGAQIWKGEFSNHLGINQKKLFQQRGALILESQRELKQISNKLLQKK